MSSGGQNVEWQFECDVVVWINDIEKIGDKDSYVTDRLVCMFLRSAMNM